MSAFDVGVGYDSAKRAITVDTTIGYSPGWRVARCATPTGRGGYVRAGKKYLMKKGVANPMWIRHLFLLARLMVSSHLKESHHDNNALFSRACAARREVVSSDPDHDSCAHNLADGVDSPGGNAGEI